MEAVLILWANYKLIYHSHFSRVYVPLYSTALCILFAYFCIGFLVQRQINYVKNCTSAICSPNLYEIQCYVTESLLRKLIMFYMCINSVENWKIFSLLLRLLMLKRNRKICEIKNANISCI